jgi:hypothetical protein
VAQSIASELHAAITPEEQQTIDKIPTTSLTAYDYYQKGKAEVLDFYMNTFRQDYEQEEALSKADKFYLKALDYESAPSISKQAPAR